MANSIAVNQTAFAWEGTDNRGNKVRGKTVAANEAAVRAELRRQGVVPGEQIVGIVAHVVVANAEPDEPMILV